MSDQNRGAYTPQSEAPLAFDARRTRGAEARPLPLTLIISAVVLAVIVIALIVFLMQRPDGSETAADQAQNIDAMKTAPETATPVTEPRPGLQVYTEGQPIAEAPTFTPPPEQPALRPATPAPPPEPAKPAPAPKAAPSDPLGALTVAPKAPTPTPAPKAATPAPAPKPAPAAKATESSGPASVQIGAFSTQAQAEKGWNDVARLLPGQMAGKTKRVETVDRGGQSLLRTYVGGFASRAEAESFCEALQARGHSCLVR